MPQQNYLQMSIDEIIADIKENEQKSEGKLQFYSKLQLKIPFLNC